MSARAIAVVALLALEACRFEPPGARSSHDSDTFEPTSNDAAEEMDAGPRDLGEAADLGVDPQNKDARVIDEDAGPNDDAITPDAVAPDATVLDAAARDAGSVPW